MFGSLGVPEIVIILAICLLIFGPKRLPSVGRSLGESIREFRGIGKQLTGDEDDPRP